MIVAPGGWLTAARDGALATLLLGGVIAAAQWLLRRLYGENEKDS
ncbi:MAG TPA: hypothetical protein VFP94_09515 [Terriglobales bacterium]|nr:hypothetical protein [Terriglobales bacterium]